MKTLTKGRRFESGEMHRSYFIFKERVDIYFVSNVSDSFNNDIILIQTPLMSPHLIIGAVISLAVTQTDSKNARDQLNCFINNQLRSSSPRVGRAQHVYIFLCIYGSVCLATFVLKREISHEQVLIWCLV